MNTLSTPVIDKNAVITPSVFGDESLARVGILGDPFVAITAGNLLINQPDSEQPYFYDGQRPGFPGSVVFAFTRDPAEAVDQYYGDISRDVGAAVKIAVEWAVITG